MSEPDDTVASEPPPLGDGIRDLQAVLLFPAFSALTAYFVLSAALFREDLYQTILSMPFWQLLSRTLLLATPLASVLFLLSRLQSRDRTLLEVKSKIRTIQSSTQAEELANVTLAKRSLADLYFEQNIQQMPLIESIAIKNHPMFKDLRWQLNSGVNVLLGRNGYGKTLLLRMLVALLSNDSERLADILGAGGKSLEIDLRFSKRSDEPDFISYQEGRIKTFAPIPMLAIPDVRTLNRTRSTLSISDDGRENLARWGYYNFLYDGQVDGLVQRALYEACLEYLALGPNGKASSVRLLNLIARVITEISGSVFSFRTITKAGAGRIRVDVVTEAQPEPVPLATASQGTLSIVAIFALVFEYLAHIAEQNRILEIEKTPGIVVIDELDAHLHPAWQRRVLDLLRRTFPNVQLVCTSHSPLTVAGCLENEVGILARAPDSTFAVTKIGHDFIGWAPDEIYREVFGIEDIDESFKTYSALYPERNRIAVEVEKLTSQPVLSSADEQRLRELSDKLYYIDKAHDARNRRSEERELKIENERLKRQLEKLTRASEAGSQ